MPGHEFPFHMTLSSIGLIFVDYEYLLVIPNEIINLVLNQAVRAVGTDIARDPGLKDQPVRDEYLKWNIEIDEIALFIEPERPNLTYGSLYAVFHLLRVWAQEYKGVECSFVIWAWPRTPHQKRLGQGHFLKDPDPPLGSGNRSVG